MAVDDSFKKPGAIPFKWELRPGVPKLHQHEPTTTILPLHHFTGSLLHHRQLEQTPNNQSRSSHSPLKLKPPPPEFKFPTRPGHDRVNPPIMPQPEVVESSCSTWDLWPKRKDNKKRTVRRKTKFNPKYGDESDIEAISSRWSESTHKSFSPFSNSPWLSPYSSNQSSPCLFSDPEWIGFGLF